MVSPRPTTTRSGFGATLAEPVAAGSAIPGGGRDVVFTFYGETWTDAHDRAMYMA